MSTTILPPFSDQKLMDRHIQGLRFDCLGENILVELDDVLTFKLSIIDFNIYSIQFIIRGNRDRRIIWTFPDEENARFCLEYLFEEIADYDFSDPDSLYQSRLKDHLAEQSEEVEVVESIYDTDDEWFEVPQVKKKTKKTEERPSRSFDI